MENLIGLIRDALYLGRHVASGERPGIKTPPGFLQKGGFHVN
jgi:hypothetical protein